MNIHLIGCSWIRGLKGTLNQVSDFKVGGRGRPGHGLNHLHKILTQEDLDSSDFIFVQLPTPVRSALKEESSKPSRNTLQYMKECPPDKCMEVMAYYREVMLEIDKLHKRVVFFVFNTAGYPFRHPTDFGSLCEEEMIQFMKEKGLSFITLNLEGQEDMVLKEIVSMYEEEISYMPNIKTHHIIHPKGKLILDSHPNKEAIEKAARIIEAYVRGAK